jgi:hypothetical protein
MGGNPKTSQWYSTRADDRVRKPTTLTLSINARTKLKRLADAAGKSKSAVVEELVMAAAIPKRRG